MQKFPRCMVEGSTDYQSVSVCAWVSAMVHAGPLYTWPFCSR